MKRAMMVVKISDAFLADGGLDHIQPPPSPWYIRGPRGGLYVATGVVQRLGPAVMDDDWPMGQQSVGYRSEGLRYLRPGTSAHREAEITTT